MRMFVLKQVLALIALAVTMVAEADGLPWYVGGSGGVLLPGNGNSLSRAAEASGRIGWYCTEFTAFELEGVCAPNVSSGVGRETLSGAGGRFIAHLTGIDEFNKLFGCERFDPFVTAGGATRFGARHVFDDDEHRVVVGPTLGIGAFYHLTDCLDLRFDAQAMLATTSASGAFGWETPCGMLYSVGVGLQWNFGGGGE